MLHKELDRKKIVSVRLKKEHINKIDLIAKNMKIERSALLQSLVETFLLDTPTERQELVIIEGGK